MKIRPGETRYRTSVYFVTDDAGKEHRVTATLTEYTEEWIVICHECNPSAMNGRDCEHAQAIRTPLTGRK